MPGAGGFVLSGSIVAAHGTVETVQGVLSNGVLSFSGTFLIEPVSGAHTALANELAASDTALVAYVPGTLAAPHFESSAEDWASTAWQEAFAEFPTPLEVMPWVSPREEDLTQPWTLIDTLESPQFDQPIVCIKALCLSGASGASRTSRTSRTSRRSHPPLAQVPALHRPTPPRRASRDAESEHNSSLSQGLGSLPRTHNVICIRKNLIHLRYNFYTMRISKNQGSEWKQSPGWGIHGPIAGLLTRLGHSNEQPCAKSQ
jgi:hypothetical protein